MLFPSPASLYYVSECAIADRRDCIGWSLTHWSVTMTSNAIYKWTTAVGPKALKYAGVHVVRVRLICSEHVWKS